jgi:predicted MFS family arabinose efflux permease
LVTYNHFLLQLFFTWAIIYIPLYLATEVGLSWAEIGTIIAVGALAYTLFEFPVGWLADNTFGEKEMMALGFLILTLAVAAIGFVDTYGVFGWAVLMFISRVGCSLIEVTTESYFFKQTTGRDSNLLSLFRMTRPGANLLGAFIGGMSLLFLPFNMIFMVLAVILLTGIFVSSRIIDTR